LRLDLNFWVTFFAALRLDFVFVVDFLLIHEEESSSSSNTTMAANSSATAASFALRAPGSGFHCAGASCF
jgi:hypothetical protein